MSAVIGTPRNRADGRPKVTGGARYTADTPVEGLTYGVLATSTVARGQLLELDTTAAEHAPGVLRVLTHLNLPKLRPLKPPAIGQSLLPLQDDRIHYEGQPIALVVAETLEQATHAATAIRARYAVEPATVNFEDALDREISGTAFFEPDSRTGDVDSALAAAPIRIERTYRTADRHHNPIELSGTIAEWRDGKLTLFDTTQHVFAVRHVLAGVFGIPHEDIRVRSAYLGGGFGSKALVWPHEILTALVAREVDRPVKLVLTRAQTYTSHGYQAASVQAVALGAARDGRLLATRHTSVTPTSMFDNYMEGAALGTRSMYACPAIETRHRVVRVSRGTPAQMRAPQEGLSMVGLECAMDELAVEVGVDPVELRLRNYADRDPTSGKPFSSKMLRACYEEGARRFRWAGRPSAPRAMRDGRHLVGWGMASAIMGMLRFPASARATLERNGTVLIEAGTQEIGTGTYTVMPQIAADVLGVPVDRVRLLLGDTTLPETGGSYGSGSTVGVGSAVHEAAAALKARLAQLAGGALPTDPAAYGEVLGRHGLERLSADGRWAPRPGASPVGEEHEWSMHTFGAVFVEVRVDEDLPIPRVSRCVGVYSAGRIINPKTARSQITGGMIWGIGQALLEQSPMDRALGRYLSKNLAGYLVPANADVPDLEVAFAEEIDPHTSTIGARGIGEVGAVGIGAAIANAIWHATGVRIRDLPIAPERLLLTASG